MATMLAKTKDPDLVAATAAAATATTSVNYVAQRGFIPPELTSNASAQRTVSATMTFPLTCAYGLRLVFSGREELKDELKVLVLGARSESSLPSIWWKESLLSSLGVVGSSLRISLLGPGLQGPPKRFSTQGGGGGKFLSVQHIEGGACKFHDHPDHMKLLLETDLFVLFNPGFGSTEALKESWTPTLRLLLMTRKPILATAHSAWDLKRDLARLDSLTHEEDAQDLGEPVEFIVPPHESPFRSTKRTFDAKEDREAQVVTTNHFAYAFQAK